MHKRSPDHGTLDPNRRAAIRAMLEDVVTADDPRRRRVSRSVVALGMGGAVALVGGTAGALVINQEPVTDRNIVHCLSRAEMTEDGKYPGSAVMIGAPGVGQIEIDDAVAACDQLWRDGLLDPDAKVGAPAVPDPRHVRPAPGTVEICIMPDGSAAVIPGGVNVCAELGLPRRQND